MSLKIQIFSLVFSFFYGLFCSIIYNLCYKLLYKTSILYKILINFLFITNLSLIYFLCLLKINNGYVHLTFLLMFIFGFVIINNKIIKLRRVINVKKPSRVKSK